MPASDRWIPDQASSTGSTGRYQNTPQYEVPGQASTEAPSNSISAEPYATVDNYALPIDSMNKYLSSRREYETPSQTSSLKPLIPRNSGHTLPPPYSSINGQRDDTYTVPLPVPSSPNQAQPSPYSPSRLSSFKDPNSHSNTSTPFSVGTDNPMYFEVENSRRNTEPTYFELENHSTENGRQEPTYFELENSSRSVENGRQEPTYFELENSSVENGLKEPTYFELEKPKA